MGYRQEKKLDRPKQPLLRDMVARTDRLLTRLHHLASTLDPEIDDERPVCAGLAEDQNKTLHLLVFTFSQVASVPRLNRLYTGMKRTEGYKKLTEFDPGYAGQLYAAYNIRYFGLTGRALGQEFHVPAATIHSLNAARKPRQ